MKLAKGKEAALPLTREVVGKQRLAAASRCFPTTSGNIFMRVNRHASVTFSCDLTRRVLERCATNNRMLFG